MMTAVRKVPVVVVLGATGTGKSKLAIDLARHFNGEIISADSMQMYKGLDIITNKVTAEEQAQCPHHLLSVLSPLSANNTVVDFRNMALPIMEKLFAENKMPVIVGGTNYYIEALLWNFLIDKQTVDLAQQENQSCKREAPLPATSECCSHAAKSARTEVHEGPATRAVEEGGDSCTDRGQVLQAGGALQVYDDHGVAMSQIHRAQHRCGNTPGLSGALRFPHCCVFWLQSQQAVLDERLDKRVDDMLSNGLVSELHQLHSEYLDSVAAQNGQPDYTLGIFQSIGFKEFHSYLTLLPDQRHTEAGKALFQEGVEELKLATRQYARRQLKWIKNRFLKRAGSEVPAVYSLDSTDPSQWSADVLQPAVNILSAIISGDEVPVQPLSPDDVPSTVHVHNVCQVCGGRVFTTLQEWQAHLASRKHQKMLQHQRRKDRAEQETEQHVDPLQRTTED